MIANLRSVICVLHKDQSSVMESPVCCKSLLLVRIRAEESLLLQLKNNLRFKSNATGNMKLVTWNETGNNLQLLQWYESHKFAPITLKFSFPKPSLNLQRLSTKKGH